MDLTDEIYTLVKKLPKEELYSLSNQMRRAAVSVPSNIAEGFGRTGSKDYPHFLSIALGSTFELQTQLILCEDLGYLEANENSKAMELCDRVGMMLNKLIKKLE